MSLSFIIKNLEMNSYFGDYYYNKLRKDLLYKSFLSFSKDSDFISFINKKTKSGNFHSKIFQKYISFLEEELPYTYVSNRKKITINSLQDLSIFDGQTSFISTSKNLIVRNESEDLFITNGEKTIGKPYYIGKLTSVTDILGNDLLKDVTHYTFNKIYLKEDNTVKISFLKIKPHHESGVLGHVNRKLLGYRLPTFIPHFTLRKKWGTSVGESLKDVVIWML